VLAPRHGPRSLPPGAPPHPPSRLCPRDRYTATEGSLEDHGGVAKLLDKVIAQRADLVGALRFRGFRVQVDGLGFRVWVDFVQLCWRRAMVPVLFLLVRPRASQGS